MAERLKKHALFLLVLFGLFFTQILFFFDEIDLERPELGYTAVIFAVFFVFYVLSIAEAPVLVLALWAVLGFSALWVFGAVLVSETEKQLFRLLTSFPPLLFFLSQDRGARKGEKNPWPVLLNIFSALLIAFFVFSLIKDPGAFVRIFTNEPDYGCVLFPLLIVLYGAILCMPKEKTGAKKKNRGTARVTYLYAIAVLTETFLLTRARSSPQGWCSVPVLWLTALLVLLEKGDPLLLQFRDRLIGKVSAFLAPAAREKRSRGRVDKEAKTE